MDRIRLLVLGCVWAALSCLSGPSAVAQSTADGAASGRDAWEQRVLGRWRPADGVVQTAAESRVAQQWQPHRGKRPKTQDAGPVDTPAAAPADDGEPERIPTPAPQTSAAPSLRPVPEETLVDPMDEGALVSPRRGMRYLGEEMDGGYEADDDACGTCGGPCDDDGWCHRCGGCFHALSRQFQFFFGVQGFKGPFDAGQNGNFGIHEGFNFGAPLGDPWHSGFQIGIQGVHSNFSGSSVTVPGTPDTRTDSNGRDQTFMTAGFFHRRLDWGLQGGVVFDYVHDNYYLQSDLKQIRSETSWKFTPEHEIGYWGAYGLDHQLFAFTFQTNQRRTTVEFGLQPHDVFAGFYRRTFSGGGQGRMWAGATGTGDAILGADLSVPLGTSWSLENSFTYMIPQQNQAANGLVKEAWGVSLQLVWYPGRKSRCIFQNPYTPLFGVADNNTFLYRGSAQTSSTPLGN